MKKIIEEKQYVISKMNTLLTSLNISLDIYNPENWLHSEPNTVKSAYTFQVQYSLGNLPSNLDTNQQNNLQKDDYLSLIHLGTYQCSSCQKLIKKLYSGFCYVCLMQKAAADMCILSPHRCHYSQGTCREPEWGLSFCYQPHYVYLAYTDKFKVGITRKNQLFTRWVDQGATMATPICLVSSRHQAGNIEKALTEILSDKSHWQKMLQSGNAHPTYESFLEKFTSTKKWLKNIIIQKPEIFTNTNITNTNKNINFNEDKISTEESKIEIFDAPSIVNLTYPVTENMEKLKSISLEKEKGIKGKITGIKGQYIFFGDRVLNIRNHEGYLVSIEKY